MVEKIKPDNTRNITKVYMHRNDGKCHINIKTNKKNSNIIKSIEIQYKYIHVLSLKSCNQSSTSIDITR